MTYFLTFFLNWTGATLPVESPIHPIRTKGGATLPVESPISPIKTKGVR